MSGDIGRGVAVLLAIILCITGPLFVTAGRSGQNSRYMIQQVLEEFTARTELNKAVTLGDYEILLEKLAGTGAVFDVEMYIGKKNAWDTGEVNGRILSEVSAATSPVSTGLMLETDSLRAGLCNAHVHTSGCYLGHNHAACGCKYHVHSDTCYCRGKMTKCYKTEYYDFFCTICDGTGKSVYEVTCSTCNGEKGRYETYKCNCKNGMVPDAAPCSKCGGSGIRSNGKECSTCGGTGNVDIYVTHAYCNGTGYVTAWFICSACRGAGVDRITEDCIFCDGVGRSSGSVSYYCCAVCDQGSTTSYGQICGKKKCEFEREGYECGIEENDMTPLCSRIITDAEYKPKQSLPAGRGLNDIDNNIVFSYLDGSKDIQTCRIEGSEDIDFAKAGEYGTKLVHTGIYLKPGEEETRYFPVKVIVEADKEAELLGIRAVNKKDIYSVGDALEADVYAVFENGESLLDPNDYWDTFDSTGSGEHIVLIGYSGFVTEMVVFITQDEREPDPETEETHPSGEPGNSGESGGGGSSENDPGESIPGGSGENGSNEGNSETSQPGENENSGNGSTETGAGEAGTVAEEEIIAPEYGEMSGTEEILEKLYSNGRIDLEDGDAFSISVTVLKESILSRFGLFRKKDKEIFTSGTVIG